MLIRTSLLAIDQAARLRFDVGDGLDLWLDDRRLGLRRDDRNISLRLTGEHVPADLVAVHVRGRIGDDVIDATYSPAPHLFFDHVWDGTASEAGGPGTPANSLVTDIEVGWEHSHSFPRPARTRWWRRQIVCGGIDMRSLGCGGITPDSVHHLDVNADILWRGDGSRLTDAQRQSAVHLARLKVKSDEVGVSDGQQAHVFDKAGNFRRTLSVLKGTVLTAARTDDTGRVTTFTKAGHRYTIDRRNDSEALLRSPAGVWAVIDFDDSGRAAKVTDQDRNVATLEWANDGGLSKVIDSSGLVTELERDEHGRVTRFSDSTGRRLDLVRIEHESGIEVTVTTAEGRETRHRTERLDDGTQVETHSCCGASNPRVIERRSLGPLGDERVVRSPDGTVATTRRSTRSDANRAVDVARTSIAAPSGRTMRVERRIDRHRTGRTDEYLTVGESTTSIRLEPATMTTTSRTAEGRETTAVLIPKQSLTVTRPGSGTVAVEFDDNGRPRRRSHNAQVLTYGYDQNGRLTWTDFERWRQHVHHDEQGRVVSIETPNGWLQFARDAAGRVIGVKTPNDSVTTIDRRADGEIVAITHPAVGDEQLVERFEYDRDGLLISRTFGDDHVIVYDRDLLGRITSTVAPDVKLSATYDEATGLLTEIATHEGSAVRYRHDGDIEWSEEAVGRVPGRIERAVDSRHQIAARRVNGAHELHVARDADGLVTTVGPLQIERTGAAGLPVGIRLGRLHTSRSYDSDGRLTSHETRYGHHAQVYFGEEIERDEFGRVVRIVERRPGRERTLIYAYNDERRLAHVQVDGETTLRLTYDASGNVVELERQGKSLHMDYDAADRLIAVANAPTSHDAAGNLTGIGDEAKVRGYRFDGLCRLVGSVDPRVQVDHALDPLGRPIEISGTALRPLRMLWDGERLAATLDRDDNVETRFIDSGAGLTPEAMIKGGLEYLLVTDHLGSVRAVIDAEQGNVVQATDYDPLGRPTMNSAPAWQPFGFAGGLHEPTSGLIRFRARTYDPFIGRFLSRDPLGFAGGQVNLYQYALGDPVNNVDPTGLRSAPSGEVGMRQGSWENVRPLTIDYDYLTTDSWRREMQPTSSSNALERRLTRWTVERHRADEQCRKINRVDMACLDNVGHGALSGGTSGGAIVLSAVVPGLGLCTDGVWQAVATCDSPLAWEFQSGTWKTGPSSLESVGHSLARVPRLLRHGGRELKTAVVRIVDRMLD